MSAEDQAEFTRRIEALGNIVAIVPPVPDTTVRPVPVSTVSRWNPGEHQAMLFRSADAKNLVFRYINPKYGYAIDDDRSPVIEFWRCIMTSEYIQRGRVYYIPSYFDEDGSKVIKPKEFIDIAQKIFAIVKKMSVERQDFFYIAKDASALAKHGYKLLST